jgi:acetyl esterase/lipase
VERRESLLNEFEKSGLSAAKFAALAGIKYQTFAAWAARRRKSAVAKAPAAPADAMRWLEAVVDQAHPPVAMVLQLPGGVRVEVSDEKQAMLAAMLVRALARSC